MSHANEDLHHISKEPCAQFALAKKKADLKRGAASRQPRIAANAARIAEAELAGDEAYRQHDQQKRAAPAVRLLDKAEVCAIANVSFPTVWAWMRAGAFPRSRVVGGKSMWLSSEVDSWLANLPVRTLKGDDAGGRAP